MVEYPFEEREKSSSHSVRVFKSDTDQDELKWHRDREDRLIEPLEKTDWKIQFENQLPILIENQIFISKGTWHRAIKGNGNLKIRITEYD